ncbi:MAG: AMP-binding protein [Hyphomicrobiales bacterium]
MPTRHDRTPLNGLSHVKGDESTPLLELTIPALLAETVDKFANREAAVFSNQNIRWTYAELATQVDRLAGGLVALGFKKGERLGIWSPNRYEWLLAQFATARVGVILVNINPAYRTFELEYALKKVGCKGLILSPSFKSSNYCAMLQELAPELATKGEGELICSKLPELKTVICLGDDVPVGMIAFDDVMAMGDSFASETLDKITLDLDCDDPINIQFTSGTTGLPKGACLTHRNIVNNANCVVDAMEFSEADRLCIPVPFYHCFGMVMGTLGCVTKGATMVVPSEGFEPIATLDVVQQEKCTALYAVPTMFVAMLESDTFDTYDLTSLRTGIMAGAPCPIEIMKKVQEDMHMTGVTIAYGMTETSPVSFQSNVDDPVSKRVSSVGRIHPHVEVKIVDEDGAIVPVGVQGELLTKGYSVMRGYWADEEQTASSIDADGWMHTGDFATLDEEGYCNITGRLKDMICRGGENIYPREVEEFLYTHDAVSQVQVFGIADEKYGEISVAWIITKPDTSSSEQEIKDYCKGKIAHYKMPAYVRFVDEIPMTVTGKPQKFIMRDKMMAELGIAAIETA